MNNKVLKPLVFITLLIMIFIQACGGSKEVVTQAPSAQPEMKAKPTESPIPAATEVPSGLVTNISDLKKATIQIEAEGTFIDPEFGYIPNAAGRGSGYIIDPSGLAVTNNHVVTGAALLKVWVGGDTNKVYNAHILGVSECSDLAVIDIEGDGFPYLSWYDQPTNVGLEVFLAGYPLGDPEYTMTEGIVSKENANGETSWASVDSVVEHTATGNPGNSGGPLVDNNAKVVGIHYASNQATQYFAIDHSIAIPVIDKLRAGKNVDSIGINGQAVSNEDGSITGIWVSSVESGSPADKAGVKAGDIVTQLEGLYLATDGTMKDYCDVLRTHSPEETLALQVLRWSSQEVLEGQLNGRTLETAYIFDSTSGDTGTTEPSGSTTSTNCEASTTSGYMTCWDDTGNIKLDVPDTWTDVSGGTWTFEDQDIGVAISAAPNLTDFANSYNVEGVFFGASDTFAQIGGYVQFLDASTVDTYRINCTFEGRYDYNDTVYRGKYDFFSNCGGAGGFDAYILSAVDIVDPTSKIILVETQVYPGDTATVEQIWGTFYIYF